MAAIDEIRSLAAGILEGPEQAVGLTGQALNAVGDALEALAKRIDELEALVRGQS